jgi:hypothetical protein
MVAADRWSHRAARPGTGRINVLEGDNLRRVQALYGRKVDQ